MWSQQCCVFSWAQERRCIVVKFPPHCCLFFCCLGIYYDLDGFPGDTSSLIQLPVYLNSSRANLLFTVSVIVHHRHCISVALLSLECVITVIIFNPFSKSQ